jgi:hypothetical protein
MLHLKSKGPKMLRMIRLMLVVSVILSPTLSNGQGGIGGGIGHRPNLGCACVSLSEGEVKAARTEAAKVALELSPKLSEEECRKKGDVPTIYTRSNVDKSAMILDKPEPEVPVGVTLDQASSRVILKAVFCPNGTVGRIGLVLGLSNALNESAIKAAKKIKFKAAIKDGNPVAQYLQVEYSFRQSQ